MIVYILTEVTPIIREKCHGVDTYEWMELNGVQSCVTGFKN